MSSDRIIPFGKIVRQHGFARAGVSTFKLQLHSAGGEIFQHRQEIYVSRAPLAESDPRSFDASNYRLLRLVAASSPLGARWQETPSVLIRVAESESELVGLEVGLLRSSFPAIENDGAIYLCDLIGARLANARGDELGRVKRFFDTGTPSRPSTNIEVERPDGRRFEFPAAIWPKGLKPIGDGLCTVPDIEVWAELDASSATPDDTDDKR